MASIEMRRRWLLGGGVALAAAGITGWRALRSAPARPAVMLGDGVNGPQGMAWVPGGTFLMGSDHPLAQPNERPAHPVRVQGFWMDTAHVTNDQFAAFVRETGHVTTAERKPDWDTIRVQLPPGTPRPPDAVLVPGAMVFVGTSAPVRLDDYAQWWRYVPGADWRHPQGPGSSIGGKGDHPVVQVSHEDALAYARWRASACRPRPNGSSLRAADWSRPPTPGATRFGPAASCRPTTGTRAPVPSPWSAPKRAARQARCR